MHFIVLYFYAKCIATNSGGGGGGGGGVIECHFSPYFLSPDYIMFGFRTILDTTKFYTITIGRNELS